MDSATGISGFVQALATVLLQFPALQQMADIALKSLVLLTLFWLFDAVVGKKLNDTSRHLLWLYSLMCLALLPFIPELLMFWQTLWPNGTDSFGQSALFELPVYAMHVAESGAIHWGFVALALYAIPATFLLSRLVFALHTLAKLRRQSVAPGDINLLEKLTALKSQLNISRAVTVRVSTAIESPISYGLIKPQIMLPAQSSQWNDSIQTDVLLHELCHIKRLDWLTTIFAYVLACVFWINPLVWLAARRLRDESENSCDTAVLHAGRSDTEYAESLLGVASSCIHTRRDGRHKQINRTNRSSYPLVQTMLDQNTLKTRISRVLEENKMNATDLRKQVNKCIAVLLLVSAGTLGVLGSHQVLYAQQQPDPATRTVDAEMLPVVTIVPNYPTLAADSGIEGWVHVRFTVSADGSVAPDSIDVVEAQPADIFNRSALAAAAQFQFNPRVVNGWPVDVPNVQYVFRYRLKQESASTAP